MVRLPAPEVNFQYGQPVRTEFLADALSRRAEHAEWSFAEAIIMSTLLGRCVTLQRRAGVISCLQTDFWTTHAHLTLKIDERRQNLVRSFPGCSVLVDPMLAFTHLLPHVAIICLGETLANVPPQTVPPEHQFTAMMYSERAIMAAREITRQAQLIPRVAFCKVSSSTSSGQALITDIRRCKAHYLLPHVLARAADHFATRSMKHGSTDKASGDEENLNTLIKVMKDIGKVNGVACTILDEVNGDSAFDEVLNLDR